MNELELLPVPMPTISGAMTLAAVCHPVAEIRDYISGWLPIVEERERMYEEEITKVREECNDKLASCLEMVRKDDAVMSLKAQCRDMIQQRDALDGQLASLRGEVAATKEILADKLRNEETLFLCNARLGEEVEKVGEENERLEAQVEALKTELRTYSGYVSKQSHDAIVDEYKRECESVRNKLATYECWISKQTHEQILGEWQTKLRAREYDVKHLEASYKTQRENLSHKINELNNACERLRTVHDALEAIHNECEGPLTAIRKRNETRNESVHLIPVCHALNSIASRCELALNVQQDSATVPKHYIDNLQS